MADGTAKAAAVTEDSASPKRQRRSESGNATTETAAAEGGKQSSLKGTASDAVQASNETVEDTDTAEDTHMAADVLQDSNTNAAVAATTAGAVTNTPLAITKEAIEALKTSNPGG